MVSGSIKNLHKILNNSAFYSERQKIIDDYNKHFANQNPEKTVDTLKQLLQNLQVNPDDLNKFTSSGEGPTND